MSLASPLANILISTSKHAYLCIITYIRTHIVIAQKSQEALDAYTSQAESRIECLEGESSSLNVLVDRLKADYEAEKRAFESLRLDFMKEKDVREALQVSLEDL